MTLWPSLNIVFLQVEEYRRMLGQFGVTGDMALQQIESLSGGQKSRVAFAVLCGHSPNFLILGRISLKQAGAEQCQAQH